MKIEMKLNCFCSNRVARKELVERQCRNQRHGRQNICRQQKITRQCLLWKFTAEHIWSEKLNRRIEFLLRNCVHSAVNQLISSKKIILNYLIISYKKNREIIMLICALQLNELKIKQWIIDWSVTDRQQSGNCNTCVCCSCNAYNVQCTSVWLHIINEEQCLSDRKLISKYVL